MSQSRVKVRELIAEKIIRVEDGNHGEYRPRPEEFVNDGVPFIRATDMTSGVVDFAGAGRISPAARERIRKGVGAPGDILLSHKGTVGKVAVAPKNSPDYVCSPQTTFWRSLDPGRLDQRYLKCVLTSADFVHQLSILQGQTDMAPYVSLTDQKSMTIPLPAIHVQRAIAEVLGALDEKIAVNAILIAAADDLRARRFRAMLGPDKARMSDLAQFVNGKAFTNGASGTGRVVIRIAELNSGIGGSTVYNDVDVAEDHLARPGDLLFAWSGSLTVHRWFRREGIINQHIFKVIPTPGIPMWVVEGALQDRLAEFRSIAADKATTMGHIQRRHLDERVSVPSSQSVANEHALMQALWDRTLAAELENVVLSSTRDELLPLLMSGKVRVRDAERVLERVL